MDSDLPQVTCPVSTWARIGPMQLDCRVSFWTIMALGLV